MGRMRGWNVGTRRPVVALVALLSIGGGAMAAGPEGPPSRPQRTGEGPPPTREELRQAMEQVMVERLKTALRLAPGQEARVIPKVEEMLSARREYSARRRPAMRRLRTLLGQDPPDQGRIREALLDLRSAELAFRERDSALRDAVFSDLSPWQQGRFLVFVERFRRQILRRLHEAAAQAPARSRPRDSGLRPAPSEDDLFDEPGGQDPEEE